MMKEKNFKPSLIVALVGVAAIAASSFSFAASSDDNGSNKTQVEDSTSHNPLTPTTTAIIHVQQ